jgi:GxxExxY protein
MRELEPAINALSERVIGAAIEVHRELGPGLLESIYEQALCREMESSGILFERQAAIPVLYKGKPLECSLRLDLIVSQAIIVELKAVDILLPIHEAQLLSYLRLARKPLGLLVNFHSPTLKQGLKRLINSHHSS